MGLVNLTLMHGSEVSLQRWWIELDYLIMSLPCTVKAQGKVAACMLDSIYIYIYWEWRDG